jgi:hypothetical protein
VDGIAPKPGDALFLHVLPCLPPGTMDTDGVLSGHFERNLDASWIVAGPSAHLPQFTKPVKYGMSTADTAITRHVRARTFSSPSCPPIRQR